VDHALHLVWTDQSGPIDKPVDSRSEARNRDSDIGDTEIYRALRART
jgi:hypothetical protein